MEAKFAPFLKNLYMGWWGEHLLFSQQNPYARHFHWFGHFIDDLLVVWAGDTMVL